MASDILPAVYKIVSLTEGNPPTSVNLTLQAFQTVYLNGPVTTWVVRKESDKTLLLSVGGYPFTGIEKDKVTATIHPDQNLEWRATYWEFQKAYTIEPVERDGKGWTVADDSKNAEIVIDTIKVLLSEPPRVSTAQLFRFEKCI